MWQVAFSPKAMKQMLALDAGIQELIYALAREIEQLGPIRGNRKNYGRLRQGKKEEKHHCHVKTGKPTYVVCWEVTDKKARIVEVYYAGTHEKAPY
jgi:mRNA-degrading endonuclease RelE of RelBE toxin-antitoxin system